MFAQVKTKLYSCMSICLVVKSTHNETDSVSMYTLNTMTGYYSTTGAENGADVIKTCLMCFYITLVGATVLLEYFAGEKPLRMSQISRKFDPLRSNYCALERIVYLQVGFAN